MPVVSHQKRLAQYETVQRGVYIQILNVKSNPNSFLQHVYFNFLRGKWPGLWLGLWPRWLLRSTLRPRTCNELTQINLKLNNLIQTASLPDVEWDQGQWDEVHQGADDECRNSGADLRFRTFVQNKILWFFLNDEVFFTKAKSIMAPKLSKKCFLQIRKPIQKMSKYF